MRASRLLRRSESLQVHPPRPGTKPTPVNSIGSVVQHVLLIEDNSGDVLMVREAIRTSPTKADLVIAYDGEQTLRFLMEFKSKPDLIILDLNVPKFNGLQILERYRGNDRPPVIVLTSSVNPTDKARALELGVKEYIVTPTDLDSFLKAVRGALERWTGGTAKLVGGT
jgi:DNA-binding response OmpR family regulator